MEARPAYGRRASQAPGRQAGAHAAAASVVHLSAVTASKSPLRYTDTGKRVIVRLFTLAAQLRQGWAATDALCGRTDLWAIDCRGVVARTFSTP